MIGSTAWISTLCGCFLGNGIGREIVA